MASDTADSQGAGVEPAPSGVLNELAASIGGQVARVESIRFWEMSSVERVNLTDGRTVILKTAREPFTRESDVLAHADVHGVPVPEVIASSRGGDWLAMLLEDLGDCPRDATLEEGVAAAAAVHACPPLDGLSVLDAAGLAALPILALASVDGLLAAGRWAGTEDIRTGLEELAEVAPRRADGAELAPYGMCHSEFHPTSIHLGSAGLRILDWAKAFTGPGLLDLASWRDTPLPLDTGAIDDMIGAYIKAGGPDTTAADRGGRPAAVWAGGWHRVWIIEWYLQQSVRWMPDPADDAPTQRVVRRHLTEALACLR